jgi:hypothetical protein
VRRRRIDGMRLTFLAAGSLAGVLVFAIGFRQWNPDADLLASLVGLFATLSGFILTVQTIAVSSASAQDKARKAEVLFRVKRLYFFFVTNIIAASAAAGALALRGFDGLLPDTVNGVLLFMAPFALLTAIELPRTLWSNHQ